MAKCSVEECDSHANRVGAGLCERHYYRLRRTGTTEKGSLYKEGPLEHNGGGYLLIESGGHPLAKGPRVYEHRVRYYDEHGKGPFDCYHCGKSVTWATLHIDHLNSDTKDNRIDNLAASCPKCNMSRGKDKMKRKMQERGIMVEFNGEMLHVSEWAKRLGISSPSMKRRLKAWPKEKALTEPRGRFGPKGANH